MTNCQVYGDLLHNDLSERIFWLILIIKNIIWNRNLQKRSTQYCFLQLWFMNVCISFTPGLAKPCSLPGNCYACSKTLTSSCRMSRLEMIDTDFVNFSFARPEQFVPRTYFVVRDSQFTRSTSSTVARWDTNWFNDKLCSVMRICVFFALTQTVFVLL